MNDDDGVAAAAITLDHHWRMRRPVAEVMDVAMKATSYAHLRADRETNVTPPHPPKPTVTTRSKWSVMNNCKRVRAALCALAGGARR